MRPLSSTELLNAWEAALPLTPARRALMLLAAASPETPVNELALLPIGERDARLMTLREWTFGARVQSMTTCANCGERLEMEFDLNDLRIGAHRHAPRPRDDHDLREEWQNGRESPVGNLVLKQAGFTVRFRLPNSFDLLALENGEATLDGRQRLLERCLLAVERRGKALSIEQLPQNVVAAVTDRMAKADPQADVVLALACQVCGRDWNAPFDIVSFFWTEIHAWALRALHEVHLLASAYGWREGDILALSPWRRRIYLEMVAR
jgi:hypothetical protein